MDNKQLPLNSKLKIWDITNENTETITLLGLDRESCVETALLFNLDCQFTDDEEYYNLADDQIGKGFILVLLDSSGKCIHYRLLIDSDSLRILS